MPEIDEKVATWRRQLIAGGIKSPAVLDELESHLLEEVDIRLACGDSEVQAFEHAVKWMGTPERIQREFNKVENEVCLTVKIGSLISAGLVIWLAIWISVAIPHTVHYLLPAANVFFLGSAFQAGFLAGGFAVYYVCAQWFGKLSATQQQSLERAVLWYSRMAAALQVVGFTLAMLCAWQNHGIYAAGTPSQFGVLSASLWLIVLWGFQEINQKNTPVRIQACSGCSILVSLTWVGGFILERGFASFHFADFWILEATIGLHLLVLGMGFSRGLVPENSQSEARYV